MPRVIAIVQARMGSSRLPGKVLAPLNGEPALVHVMRRIQACPVVAETYLATSTLPANDPLADLAQAHGWPLYRGDEHDVLGRYAAIAQRDAADVVIRGSGDNMAIDPEVLRLTVEKLLRERLDLCSAFLDAYSYPFGAGAETVTRACLLRVEAETRQADPAYREHIFMWAHQHRSRFRMAGLAAPPRLARPEINISVDTAEDLHMMAALYRRLARHGSFFALEDLIAVWDALRAEEAGRVGA